MRLIPVVLFLCLLLGACGPGPAVDGAGGSDGELATLSSFPVTLEGELVLDVIEGDSDFGDYSDANFGDLEVEGRLYLVHAAGPVAQASGLPVEGAQARVTISGLHGEVAGYQTYEVSRIETR